MPIPPDVHMTPVQYVPDRLLKPRAAGEKLITDGRQWGWLEPGAAMPVGWYYAPPPAKVGTRVAGAVLGKCDGTFEKKANGEWERVEDEAPESPRARRRSRAQQLARERAASLVDLLVRVVAGP